MLHTFLCMVVLGTGEMLGKCAFSGDGSLLAVTAASSVTMWDPQLNTMVGQLSVPTAKASSKSGTLQFSHLKFVAKSVFLVGVEFLEGLRFGLESWFDINHL